jgi:Tfp pilus assembly protein PilF
VKTIEPPDSHFISAASGWLGLGNWREASEELDKVNPALATHREVLELRYQICVMAKKWDSAAEYAVVLLERFPSDPGSWISVAYATRRKPGGGIEKAREILSVAQQRFPHEPIIAYNLACYDCQLNRLDDARQWLARAMKLGVPSVIKQMALDDSDLKALWSEIAGL